MPRGVVEGEWGQTEQISRTSPTAGISIHSCISKNAQVLTPKRLPNAHNQEEATGSEKGKLRNLPSGYMLMSRPLLPPLLWTI